jgi:hypothetical protein
MNRLYERTYHEEVVIQLLSGALAVAAVLVSVETSQGSNSGLPSRLDDDLTRTVTLTGRERQTPTLQDGTPASHGCVRVLRRDAQWLFEWGESWTLDTTGTRIVRPGTPVFVVGQYDFDAPPPWRSPAWLAQAVEMPPLPDPVRQEPEDE